MILTKTPYRVSLFGGGTDYPEWFEKSPGAVLGMAIDQYCYVGVKRMPPGQELVPGIPLRYRVQYSKVNDCNSIVEIKHPAVRGALLYYGIDQPLEFHCFGDLPGRSGLGGSSAFTVGLCHALNRLLKIGVFGSFDAWSIATDAIRIEQDVIKETVGCQDQVFAAHGGLNLVTFSGREKRSVRRLDLPMEQLEELQYSMLLVYTGSMRDAHVMAAKTVEAMPGKEAVLERMKNLALEGADLLLNHGPVQRIGPMLHEAWELKRLLCQEVSTPWIDKLYRLGLDCGATGGKLLGAGGGGFMLFFVPPNKRNKFEDNIGFPWVPFRISWEGSTAIITEEL